MVAIPSAGCAVVGRRGAVQTTVPSVMTWMPAATQGPRSLEFRLLPAWVQGTGSFTCVWLGVSLLSSGCFPLHI